jgi:outer membrane protein TolC
MRAFALCLLAVAAHAEMRRLTVEDAVTLLLQTQPQLVATRARAGATQDLARSQRGRLLPSIRLSEEYQHYNSPFIITFGMGMVQLPFSVRDQDTNSFSASVDQPLLGLGKLTEEYLARRGDGEAAAQGVRASEDDLKAAMRIAFLRCFEARASEDLALASAQQLDDQVQVTQAKVNAGVLTTADLLRVKVAADNARQQAIVARSQSEIARAQILSAIGLRPDSPVELVEPAGLLAEAAPAPMGYDEAARMRHEVAAARAAAASAEHRKKAFAWAMAPDIDAEGAYLRVDGSVFAPANSAFVGVRASWTLWEWGASFYALRAAEAAARAAHADLESRTRGVEVELATRNAELGAATSAVKLADNTIVSAEEAYRVTAAQVRAGAATTTDLLDSQAALTQARLNRSRARYEEAIAKVNLQHAQGR